MLKKLTRFLHYIQEELFPFVEKVLEEPLTDKLKQVIKILDFIKIEDFIHTPIYTHGKSPKYRRQMGKAFVVKTVYNMETTRELIDRLQLTPSLRRICGWGKASEIPHESSFSRAFAEFTEQGIISRVHECLIKEYYNDVIIGHNSRDSTAIEAREKPVKKKKSVKKKSKRKRGRPKKSEELKKEPTRLERQQGMTLEEMLEDLPKVCDVGTKKNSKGYKESWIGYKLHIDIADGDIPISCILTSGSIAISRTYESACNESI